MTQSEQTLGRSLLYLTLSVDLTLARRHCAQISPTNEPLPGRARGLRLWADSCRQQAQSELSIDNYPVDCSQFAYSTTQSTRSIDIGRDRCRQIGMARHVQSAHRLTFAAATAEESISDLAN